MYDVDYSERDISFKLEGKSFDDGYDFNDTLASLNYFQDILDKAYLTIVNKDRMSKVDRAVFKIKATDIRHGSFITDLMLYTGAAIQVAYPVINTYYPSLLLDVTKQGFEYLKTVLKANKEDKKISINYDGEGDVMVLSIEGDNNAPININTKAFMFAGKAYGSIKDLSSLIDGENIKSVDISDKTGKRNIINLGVEEKKILNVESKIDETPINITGKIFRIDIWAKSGKLLVIESDDNSLIDSEISFEIMDDDDIKRCCSVIDKEVKFSVLRKTQYDPSTLKDQVKSLKIFRIYK
jgi:hypothetical protein